MWFHACFTITISRISPPLPGSGPKNRLQKEKVSHKQPAGAGCGGVRGQKCWGKLCQWDFVNMIPGCTSLRAPTWSVLAGQTGERTDGKSVGWPDRHADRKPQASFKGCARCVSLISAGRHLESLASLSDARTRTSSDRR